jgi:Carboxypeptidase regulatory-like domain
LLLRILRIWLLTLAAIAVAVPLAAQDVNAPKPDAGHITGTVTDVNDDPVPGATVVLEGPAPAAPRTVVSNDNGFFEFNDLVPGIPYHVTISAQGFANWASPTVTLKPGETQILTGSKLQIAQALTTISVAYTAEEVATEQVKVEEQQRVLGIIPNFYVAYDHNAEALTAKLKFRLALRTSVDPVTIGGVAVLAAINQAADIPNYGQGWGAYADRFGSAAADGLIDIMIGGAILPSLLHQDPRYFYQGEGTTKSRTFHALSSPFVCRGDNGKLQPNYSTIGGDLATAAISNAYYPASNRGVGQTFDTLLINTAERMFTSLAQEFIVGKLTTRGKPKQ